MATNNRSPITPIRMDKATLEILDALVVQGDYKSRSNCVKSLILEKNRDLNATADTKKILLTLINGDEDIKKAILALISNRATSNPLHT